MTRIIAGRAKGARLETPTHDRTRPTSDRVREALFSSLVGWMGTFDEPVEEQLAGLAVLDLFSGSGAIGLEAASRGAKPVVLVEKDGPTAKLIARNAATTKLSVSVVTSSVSSYLTNSSSGKFDVVFLDPPYDVKNEEISKLLKLLFENNWLADDALVVLERSKRDGVPELPAVFEYWERGYGDTVLHYLQGEGSPV